MCLGAIQVLAEATRVVKAGAAVSMQASARATALRYSLENEELEAMKYWQKLTVTRYSFVR